MFCLRAGCQRVGDGIRLRERRREQHGHAAEQCEDPRQGRRLQAVAQVVHGPGEHFVAVGDAKVHAERGFGNFVAIARKP